MNNKNLDQALAALGDALKSQNPDAVKPLTPLELASQLPKRALSGDHIVGGKILKFASAGITDSATKEQLVITDNGITINGTVDSLTANIIKVDVLEVKDLRADIQFEKDQPIIFAGKDVYGKGLLWKGQGSTKQFVFNSGPDKFFSSEIIDIAKDKYLSMDGVKVLDGLELGPSITKSNLREVGRLKGLVVDGGFSVNSYLFFNATANRLGLGTDQPNAAFSIADDGVELMLGSKDGNKGVIGTFNSVDLDLVTDNTTRLSIKATGDIELGNKNTLPIKVTVNGVLGVNVLTPDPRAVLHVGGALKFNDTLHLKGTGAPQDGNYNQGDIVWNAKPQQRGSIGWVCVQGGSPGIWATFGEIK